MFFKKNKILIYLLYIFLPLIAEVDNIFSIGKFIIFFQFLAAFYIIYNIKKAEAINLKGKSLYLSYLLLIGLLSTIDSDLRFLSVKRFLLAGGNLFMMNIFVNKIIRTKEDISIFLKYVSIVFISIGLISSVYQILITRFGHNISVNENIVAQSFSFLKINFIQVINGRRPASFFKNPNTYALFLLISQMFLVFNMVIKKINLKIGILFFIIQFSGIISSKSRSALLSLFIFLFVLFFMYRIDLLLKMKKRTKTILSALIFSLIFVVFLKIIMLRPDSSGRLDLWINGLNSIYHYPLLGVGFGVSSELILPGIGISLHNSFIKIASEIGLVGFLLFIYIIYDVLMINYKCWLKYRNYDNIFYLAIIISFTVHEMFEGLLFSFNFFNNLFFLIILISMFSEVPNEEYTDYY